MADYSLKEIFKDNPQGYADYKAGQKQGKWSDYNDYLGKQGGTSGSPDTINKAIEYNQTAIKPAVSALEAQKSPLIDRYNNLINDLKGQQTTETNRQTVTTQNELGRRGIIGGGLAEQELTNALNPITSQYSGMIQDTGYAREQGLAELATQIAQLQANAGMTGVGQGYAQNQFNQNYALQQQQLQSQISQADAARKLQEMIYKNISLPESQYNLNAPYYKPTAGASTNPVDRLKALSDLFNN